MYAPCPVPRAGRLRGSCRACGGGAAQAVGEDAARPPQATMRSARVMQTRPRQRRIFAEPGDAGFCLSASGVNPFAQRRPKCPNRTETVSIGTPFSRCALK